MPKEYRSKLANLIDELPEAIFAAMDSLGWVYQFWQSKNKEEINDSGTRIGPDELPAVTQFFTEPYMVRFLLDNTLGAWYVSHNPDILCPVDLPYLRLTENGVPTASGFVGWPDKISELKLLDPCCGSGHFLVAALLMLAPMRMKLEDTSATEAIDAVLRDNLYGLEIDQRCVALAAFALAFAAWTYPGAGGFRLLPQLNLACSGLAPNMARDQWIKLADLAYEAGREQMSTGLPVKARNTLYTLYDLFAQGPLLGTLIDPSSVGHDVFHAGFEEVQIFLTSVLQQEQPTYEQTKGVIAAKGMAHAAELLLDRYTLVITNVPYLGRHKQGEVLRLYCAQHYPTSKKDLATVFLERCIKLCAKGGTAGMVLPQNWLFLKTYKQFRKTLLEEQSWHLVARLGARCFQTITGEVVNAIMLTLSQCSPDNQPGRRAASNVVYLIDVSQFNSPQAKATQLVKAVLTSITQNELLRNPDARITLSRISGPLLKKHVSAYGGITSRDKPRFTRKFWELPGILTGWRLQQSTVSEPVDFGGREHMLHWGHNNNLYIQGQKGVWMQGRAMWDQQGVAVSQMGKLPASRYTGELFDNNTAAVGPADDDLLPALWCFCSSPDYNTAVRQLDQTLKVTNATLTKVPFDREHWAKIARERYPMASLSPIPTIPHNGSFMDIPVARSYGVKPGNGR